MELSTTLPGIQLRNPVMNAAGTCKTLDDVTRLLTSSVSAIVVGSITVEARPGNMGHTYWGGAMYSLNSKGLPNPGRAFYKENIPIMAERVHAHGQKLFVSVAGFSPEQYVVLTEMAFSAGADLVELNLGCPNVWQRGAQKRIACFDPQLVCEILKLVKEWIVGTKRVIALKISPFSDPFALSEVAKVISESGIVDAVITTNTFPNSFGFNEMGHSRITPAGGLAGMAGPALKPIGLGQVRQLRSLLPERIKLVGVGGIHSGRDAYEYIQNGASAVQVATAYFERGPEVFNSIVSELKEL